MKIEDMDRIQDLVFRRNRMLGILHDLNLINGGELLNIPNSVFEFVDRELAAKGLISLIIKALAQNEKDLTSLGVEL